MNKYCYRVIFNQKTGSLVAVSEMATSCRQNALCRPVEGMAKVAIGTRLVLRHLIIAIAVLCGGMHIAQAQIVADMHIPAAVQPIVTHVDQTPTVQITAPNSAGVSHNQYQQFNIDTQGAVLSNNTSTVNTHLAGPIAANPNLSQTGAAKVIINEVTSTNPSILKGYLEVAGQRADVVVSNPNGISVGNFGFINTQRGILTTGVPLFGGTGSLDAFRVNSGSITVMDNAQFNDPGTDQVDLIARSITVNGKIWSNNINVVTGVNTVNYQDLGVSVIDGRDEKPTVAIDVAQVGGMYANKIMMIGTEDGVGVHHQGALVAKAGEFVLDAKGDVILAGSVHAAGNVQIAGKHVETSQLSYSRKNVVMTATEDLLIQGGIVAQNAIALHSGKSMHIDADVVAQDNIDLTSGADVVHGKGTIINHGIMTINAAKTVNNTARICTGEMVMNVREGVVNSGSNAVIYSRWKTYIGTDQLTNEHGALLQSENGAVISGNTTDNSSNTKRIVNNGATIDIGGALVLYADAVENTNAQFTSATGSGEWIAAAGNGTRYNTGGAEYSTAQAEVRDNGHYKYLYIFATGEKINHFTTMTYSSDKQQAPVVATSLPGVLNVQGNVYYYGQSISNDKSTVQLGGHLMINDKELAEMPDVFHRIDAMGPALFHDTGTMQYHGTRRCGFFNTCNDFKVDQAYEGQHYQDVAMHAEQFKDEAKPQRTLPGEVALPDMRLLDEQMFTDGMAPVLSYYAQLWDPYVHSEMMRGFMAEALMKQRYLTGKASRLGDVHVDLDKQYQALIAAGIAFGKQTRLIPGQALTASQKAALSEDIIWLVAHRVSMPNGQVASVMTPVLFRAQARSQ